MKSLVLILTSLLFISCSNMTVGFEEDSPFYNGPLLDTREDVNAKEKVAVKDEKETDVKEKVIQIEETVEESATKEGETTFSYERDDD